MANGWLVIKNFVFGGNYFACGEFVLYINHSGKYIEINFDMKIPYTYIYRYMYFSYFVSRLYFEAK